MINNISSIKFNTKIIFTSPFYKFDDDTIVSKESFELFFNTLLTMTNSKESLTINALKDFKQLMINENNKDTKAYIFIENIMLNFDKISTDKSSITRNDLYNFFQGNRVYLPVNLSFADDITSVFGFDDRQLSVFVKFMEQFSKDTLEKIGSKHSFSVARGERKVPVMDITSENKLTQAKDGLSSVSFSV